MNRLVAGVVCVMMLVFGATGTMLAQVPVAPVATAATGVTTTSFITHWNSVPTATSYKVYISTDPLFGDNDILNGGVVTGTSLTQNGLSPGGSYYYRVLAHNGSGDGPLSNIIPVQTIPPAPNAQSATDVVSSSFTANWDGTTGANSYQLDVSPDNFSTYVSGFQNFAVVGTSASVSGLTGNTLYRYRVRAVNTGGVSINSNVITQLTAPDPPDAHQATAVDSSTFTASWGTSTGAVKYMVDVARDASFLPSSRVFPAYWNVDVGTATSLVVTGLLNTQTYFYRVRAIGTVDSSEFSNLITVPKIVTSSPLPSGTTGVPFNQPLVAVGGGGVYSNWHLVGGSLPTGITLDPNTGLISGTTAVAGPYSFEAEVTDNESGDIRRYYSGRFYTTPTIAFDNATSIYDDGPGNERTGSNTMTWQHSIGSGSNRMLIVELGTMDSIDARMAVSSLTYAGKQLTFVIADSAAHGGLDVKIGLWYLQEKDLPAPGSYPVVATLSNTVWGMAAGSISLSGVQQVSPEAKAGSADSAARDMTTFITTHSNNAWLVDAAVHGYNPAFYRPFVQHERFLIANGRFDQIGSTKEVITAGPDSMVEHHVTIYNMTQVVMAVAPLGSPGINASAKFFLQGPFVSGQDTMSSALRRSAGFSAHFGSIPIPSRAVDSVNIEIRDSIAASKATVRQFAPAWLMYDGTIRSFVDTTKNYVEFTGASTGNYYLVARHRNHLAVMSSSSVSLTTAANPTAYDFSSGSNRAYATTPMILPPGASHYALVGGNASNADGVINALDRVATRNFLGANDYNNADVDLSGLVNALDRVLARNNLGQVTIVP